MNEGIEINGLMISKRGLEESADLVIDTAKKSKGLKLCCCSLNDIVLASTDIEFFEALKRADVRTPDGMPLVWKLRQKFGRAERVYGPDLMRLVLKKSVKENLLHYFLGDKKNGEMLVAEIKKNYPGIKIARYEVLPFKDRFTESDYREISKNIKKSHAGIVWVGIGSKKQVIMADQLDKKVGNAVYLTVGAAFDFLSGNKKQCPKFVRNLGGEWLYRWLSEPRRLGNRYIEVLKFVLKGGLK